MYSPSNFKVAIIGAGPAGLTLASLLTASKNAFDFTIFERRERPDADAVNHPSGNLDLQEEYGLKVVKACGLYDQFLQIDSGCTEQTTIVDKTGRVFLDHLGEGRPEISRNALAQLLLSAVPEERIRWSTRVLSVDTEKGTVSFQRHNMPTTEEAFDLIVGADGAWSKARAAIPGAVQPIYSGVCSVTLDLPPLADNHPDLHKLLGGGTFAACSDGKVLLSQRGIHGTARLYLFLHSTTQAATRESLAQQQGQHNDQAGPNPLLDADRLLSSLPTNHADLLRVLLSDEDFFAGWSEELRKLLTVACEAQPADLPVDARPLYMLPLEPFPHPHTPGLALVGDAAHHMTPFAGKGVNTAMADSLALAEQLEKLADSQIGFAKGLDEALVAFENEVHPRGLAAMKLTWLSLLLSYDENGPGKLCQVMAANH
jgi:2-polyprenyl-6-methoxyphenol hydroxylase-like FAD-dependent oxidoreductase